MHDELQLRPKISREDWLAMRDAPIYEFRTLHEYSHVKHNREVLARLAPECDDYNALADKMVAKIKELGLNVLCWPGDCDYERSDVAQQVALDAIWQEALVPPSTSST